jgi:hypothetical protein
VIDPDTPHSLPATHHEAKAPYPRVGVTGGSVTPAQWWNDGCWRATGMGAASSSR